MARNTFFLITALAVIAALVVGVNIGRSINQKPQQPVQQEKTASPSASPTPSDITYSGCGITLTYPQSMTKLDVETGGAMFVDTKNPSESFAVACQKDIPRPALAPDKVETVTIGSTSAKLYHDSSAKDGKVVDKLIFHDIKTNVDVYVSGFGDTFKKILSTLVVN